jgi:hypothetical protein
MRGSLHCATDDETVCRFGRDDDSCGGDRRNTAMELAGFLGGPLFAFGVGGLVGWGRAGSFRLRGCGEWWLCRRGGGSGFWLPLFAFVS